MNILHIISSIDPKWGGPIEGVRQQARVWHEFGANVEVLSLDPPDASYVTESELKVTALGPSLGSYSFNLKIVPWLKANRSRFSAVIVNGIWGFHGFATHWVLRDSSTPYVVFTHGMLDPWFKRTYPLKHLKKWLYWPWGEYRVLRDASAVFFTCEEERILARQSFWLYRCNERVVRYGTAGPNFELEECVGKWRSRFPELNGKRIALFVGRIAEKKGCDIAIGAFASALAHDKDWHLVIAGPDTEGLKGELMRLAAGLGISDRITWAGTVSGDLKWGAFSVSEILILPSHQENFGIVVAEALACSLPVLISDKVNIWREVVADGAGFVAADNLEATDKLLRTWSKLSPEERDTVRDRARASFENRFEIHSVVADLVRHLAEFVHPRGLNDR